MSKYVLVIDIFYIAYIRLLLEHKRRIEFQLDKSKNDYKQGNVSRCQKIPKKRKKVLLKVTIELFLVLLSRDSKPKIHVLYAANSGLFARTNREMGSRMFLGTVNYFACFLRKGAENLHEMQMMTVLLSRNPRLLFPESLRNQIFRAIEVSEVFAKIFFFWNFQLSNNSFSCSWSTPMLPCSLKWRAVVSACFQKFSRFLSRVQNCKIAEIFSFFGHSDLVSDWARFVIFWFACKGPSSRPREAKLGPIHVLFVPSPFFASKYFAETFEAIFSSANRINVPKSENLTSSATWLYRS